MISAKEKIMKAKQYI